MPAGTTKRRQIGGRMPSSVTFSVNVDISKPLLGIVWQRTRPQPDSSSRASRPSAIRLSMKWP
jgi:hypothetical protein